MKTLTLGGWIAIAAALTMPAANGQQAAADVSITVEDLSELQPEIPLAAIGNEAPAAEATTVVEKPASAETAAPPVRGASEPGDPDQLTFNFKGVPLSTVTEYLSRAGGFVIVPTVEVEGRVDVMSLQPLSRDEAVDLLNSVLYEKGYTAIRKERVLTIVRRDDARTRLIPVRRGNDPAAIANTDEMVTQIIPVQYANARAMVNDLQNLLPEYATISANESSNTILITDTQASVRRMTEVIQALDQSISSISDVKVFSLQNADAKETAALIVEVFTPESSAGGSGRDQAIQRFLRVRGGGGGGRGGGGRGGGGGFGGFGENGGNEGTGDSAALQAASRVTAAADERTNSLVVGAPADMMQSIERLVDDIDRPIETLRVVEVFPLAHADATETAEMITNIFSQQQSGANSFFGGGGRGGGGGGRGGGRGGGGRGGFNPFALGGSTQSQRQTAESTVSAVPDTRTNAVIVSAAPGVMGQVGQVVAELDKNPARAKRMQVYSVKNANPEEITLMLQEMFGSEATTGNRQRTGQQGTGARGTGTGTQGRGGNQGGGGNTGFGTTGNSGRANGSSRSSSR
jgi:general secretion pathway protein D